MSFTAKEVADLKKLVAPKAPEVATVVDETLTVICDHTLSEDEKKWYKGSQKIWF